jgi:predicted esterase
MIRRPALPLAAAVTACVLSSPPAQAQERAKQQALPPGQVVLPPGHDAKRSYPVLVVLPYTHGTSEAFVVRYDPAARPKATPRARLAGMLRALYPDAAARRRRAFILLLAPGAGSEADHSWRGFSAAIRRYERRVLADLEALKRRRRVDASRVVLAGYSLGGDLSWALAVRNPQVFGGVITMGSRCSFARRGGIEALAARGFRAFIAMGERERPVRLRVLRHALAALKRARVWHRYHRIPGAGHAMVSLATFRRALALVLFRRPAGRRAPHSEKSRAR